MLSYMLPTEDKSPQSRYNRRNKASRYSATTTTTTPKCLEHNNSEKDKATAKMISGRIEDEQQQSTPLAESPKHNGTAATRKSTLHHHTTTTTSSKVTKDDSLYSIDSDASTVGSDRKNRILNGPKHASLKRYIILFNQFKLYYYLYLKIVFDSICLFNADY